MCLGVIYTSCLGLAYSGCGGPGVEMIIRDVWGYLIDVGRSIWTCDVKNRGKRGLFLRDGIALGRGVHRFWGVPIQKSRSNFGLKLEKSRKIGILGVGVV